MKWLPLLAALPLLALLGLALLGSRLPRHHRVSRSESFPLPPHALYALLRDFAAQPAWRPDVRSIELLPARDGHACYRETSRHGAVTYLVLVDQPGEKLVTKIADEQLPFGGTWTFELNATGQGSALRITEDGEIKNALFRGLARYVFGYDRTLRRYLQALQEKVASSQ